MIILIQLRLAGNNLTTILKSKPRRLLNERAGKKILFSDFWIKIQDVTFLKKKKKKLLFQPISLPLLAGGEGRGLGFLQSMAKFYFLMSFPTWFKLGIMFRQQFTRAVSAAPSRAVKWNQASWPSSEQWTWISVTEPASWWPASTNKLQPSFCLRALGRTRGTQVSQSASCNL